MAKVKRLTGVGAVIRNRNLVLVQDHIKSGCWTIPVGKAEEGETYLAAITRELKEELNLEVKSGRSLIEKEQYCKGVDAMVMQVVFEIEVRDIKRNKEPRARETPFYRLDESRRVEKDEID